MSLRIRLLAAALLGLGALGAAALPARAGTPAVQISSPAPGSESASETPTLAGTVSATGGGATITGDLGLSVVSAAGHPGYSDTVSNWCNRSACSFTVASAPLRWNGQYSLYVSVQETDPPTGAVHSSSATVAFSVAAPPVAPTGLSARPAADGSSITVGWTANPEPDIVGYEVTRSPAGSGRWPAAVSSPSFTDNSVTPGTSYSYQVTAVRAGATSSSTVTSPPSSTSADDPVPASDPSPSAAATPSGGSSSPSPSSSGSTSGAGTPGTGTKAGSGSLGTYGRAQTGAGTSHDLSSFDSLLAATGARHPSAASAYPAQAAPDLPLLSATGVAPGSDNPEVAPFSSGALTGTQEAGVRISYVGDSHHSAVKDFAAVATAALLLALATHLLWLRRQVNVALDLVPSDR